MLAESDEIILDSGIPKSRVLAGWLGFFVFILTVGYLVVGASFIGLPIREINPVGVIGFAAIVILLMLLSNRFGNQFTRELVTLKNGILTHQDQNLWRKRMFSLVRDEVERFDFRNSAHSFTVSAITVNGRRIVARDIARSRKEEYLSALGEFAPVIPARRRWTARYYGEVIDFSVKNS